MIEDFPKHSKVNFQGVSKPNWIIYDNSILSYTDDFAKLDAENCLPSVFEYLRSQPMPVILDLMSGTAALSTLREKILFHKPKIKALAVGLEQKIKPNHKELEEFLGIQAMEGDLNSTHTWKRINNWLGEDKAHLIMERG